MSVQRALEIDMPVAITRSPVQVALVDLWYTFFSEASDERQRAHWRRHLTVAELEMEPQYRLPLVRNQFLASRALVRSVLSKYLALAPQKVPISYRIHGKPYVNAATRSVYFNVAHAHGIAVCAVTEHGEIGIDVERQDRNVNLELASRYFAPEEVSQLSELPVCQRPQQFLQLWTLKEALIKAVGTGLTMPLDSFAFALGNPQARLTYCRQAGPASRWLARCDPFFSDYWLALVVESHQATAIAYRTFPWSV